MRNLTTLSTPRRDVQFQWHPERPFTSSDQQHCNEYKEAVMYTLTRFCPNITVVPMPIRFKTLIE
ncbi:hypothetical protein [Paenibacillus sp. FSL H7-0714]|uniref:hypothetical protein n=1 Tax=Paenibacillus sp. FSL H7-0714 TaxID=2954735 RepID=UPI0030FBF4AB